MPCWEARGRGQQRDRPVGCGWGRVMEWERQDTSNVAGQYKQHNGGEAAIVSSLRIVPPKTSTPREQRRQQRVGLDSRLTPLQAGEIGSGGMLADCGIRTRSHRIGIESREGVRWEACRVRSTHLRTLNSWPGPSSGYLACKPILCNFVSTGPFRRPTSWWFSLPLGAKPSSPTWLLPPP